MQIRFVPRRRLAQRHRFRKRFRRDVPVGRPARHMIVPAATHRVIEQDALEAMVGADRPAPVGGKRRERLAGQAKPARLQRGTIGGEAGGW